MINALDDQSFVDGITQNQTYKLIQEYTSENPSKTNQIRILEQVNLMTPENIHLKSFMYEPILDMSNHHLKKLYENVKLLN